MTKEEPKTCFVICPIGEHETEERERSDQVLNEIIKPAVEQCGYGSPVRGDKIGEPGVITRQLIEYIYRADLVIADLTDHNPNVFYELAFRHTIKRPAIMIMHTSQKPPFDVAQSRLIRYNHRDLTVARQCREEIIKQIRSIEENPDRIDSPISIAVDFQRLRDSEHLLEKSLSTIMDKLDDIRSSLPFTPAVGVWRKIAPGTIVPASINPLVRWLKEHYALSGRVAEGIAIQLAGEAGTIVQELEHTRATLLAMAESQSPREKEKPHDDDIT